jgi:chromosome segregation ATPase
MCAGKTEELRSQLEGKQAVLAPKREALLALQSRVATIETEMALLREASSTAQRQVAEAKARAQGASTFDFSAGGRRCRFC